MSHRHGRNPQSASLEIFLYSPFGTTTFKMSVPVAEDTAAAWLADQPKQRVARRGTLAEKTNMRRKNLPLVLGLITAIVLFLLPVWRDMLPAWPGYGDKAYILVNAPLVVLRHVRVIDGTGAPPLEDSTVILSGSRIQAIGNASTTPVPSGAEVFDFTGYSVMPGLVGMHDHMFYPAVGNVSDYKEMGFSFPRLYLASGVTTIRTTGGIEPSLDLRLKRQIDRGWLAGPKMHVTGPYLDSLSGPNEATKTVELWADKGVTSVKAYMRITRAELAAAIEAAHKRGLKVTGHLCAVGFREATALGIDNLEHGLVVDAEFDPGKTPDICPPETLTNSTLAQLDVEGVPVQEMIRDLVRHHVAITSTLPVFETFVPFRAPVEPRVLAALLPASREDYLKIRAEINLDAESPWTVLLKKEMQFEHDFVSSGGLLLAGEDPSGYGGNLAGFGDQREVELLVEAGFTPVEAIHVATANGAEYLGELGHIGTLAPGKQADLIVIKGDPSLKIADIEKVEIVFKDGLGYDSAKLIGSVRNSVGSR
jgi:imidazolonepropionase-like amidohydrolase